MTDDDNSANAGVAPWILEAEELYLTQKLSSLRAIAQHFGSSEGTVFSIAKRRRWAERRKAVENEAARKLAAEIDERAAQDLADTYAAMRQNSVHSGLVASKLMRYHWDTQLRRASEAQNNGTHYVIVPPPRGVLEQVELAQSFEPRVQPGVADGVVQMQAMVEKMLADRRSEIDVTPTDDEEAFEFTPALSEGEGA